MCLKLLLHGKLRHVERTVLCASSARRRGLSQPADIRAPALGGPGLRADPIAAVPAVHQSPRPRGPRCGSPIVHHRLPPPLPPRRPPGRARTRRASCRGAGGGICGASIPHDAIAGQQLLDGHVSLVRQRGRLRVLGLPAPVARRVRQRLAQANISCALLSLHKRHVSLDRQCGRNPTPPCLS